MCVLYYLDKIHFLLDINWKAREPKRKKRNINKFMQNLGIIFCSLVFPRIKDCHV